MAKKEQLVITGKLIILGRENNSTNGNPRYRALIGETEFYTRVDSSYGYSITNYRDKEVTVSLSYAYNKLCIDKIEIA
jgi:hypothetical protein